MTHDNIETTPELDRLQSTIGYFFKCKLRLINAFTHRSYVNEFRGGTRCDNERLEFLGDAVLDLVVSEFLFSQQPCLDEGDLTRIRAEVVSSPCLAKVAGSMNLGQCLFLGKGEAFDGGRNKPGLLADALEALIGAVFIDGGYASAKSVTLRIFQPLLKGAIIKKTIDHKSRLQELLQSQHQDRPVYRLVNASGTAHAPLYLVEVLIDDRVCGTGEGRSKKIAEQNAAKSALAVLENNS
jgi:ribonuclease-3